MKRAENSAKENFIGALNLTLNRTEKISIYKPYEIWSCLIYFRQCCFLNIINFSTIPEHLFLNPDHTEYKSQTVCPTDQDKHPSASSYAWYYSRPLRDTKMYTHCCSKSDIWFHWKLLKYHTNIQGVLRNDFWVWWLTGMGWHGLLGHKAEMDAAPGLRAPLSCLTQSWWSPDSSRVQGNVPGGPAQSLTVLPVFNIPQEFLAVCFHVFDSLLFKFHFRLFSFLLTVPTLVCAPVFRIH